MLKIRKIYNRIIIYSVIIGILCTFLFFINNFIDNKNVLANYVLDGDINYSIEAKEGMLVGDNSSNQDLFVSSTINNILVDFNYKFSLDNDINYKYKYEMNSCVIAELDDSSIDNKEVFRKQQKLVNTNYLDSFSNSFSVNDRISLNYDFYNAIAKEYNNSVNIPVKSKLLLELKIYVEFENGEQEEYKHTLSLPLEKNTFSISINSNEYKGEVFSSNKNSKKMNFNIFMISIIIIFIGLIILELVKFFKYKKEHYIEFKYRKIMKDYDNIVVPINALPKDNDLVSIKVLYFKSMIDIQKELHLPILCYRGENFIVYIIMNNKLAYIYFLNNNKEKI